MDDSKVRCPQCNFPLPSTIAGAVHTVTCPICHALVELPGTQSAPLANVATPTPDAPADRIRSLVKNALLFVAFGISCWVWVDLEMKKQPQPVFPRLPVGIPPPMPEMFTHPDAGPEECARLRAANGVCIDGSTLRTCDDAGVVTDERCGMGMWPCERDGRCGAGARCCVPAPYVPALDALRDAGITGAE